MKEQTTERYALRQAENWGGTWKAGRAPWYLAARDRRDVDAVRYAARHGAMHARVEAEATLAYLNGHQPPAER